MALIKLLIIIVLAASSILTYSIESTSTPESIFQDDPTHSDELYVHLCERDQIKLETIVIKCVIENSKIALKIVIPSSDEIQTLNLALSTTDEGLFLFDHDSPNCNSDKGKGISYNNKCFNAQKADRTTWCSFTDPCSISSLCLECNGGPLDQPPVRYSTFNIDGFQLDDLRIQGNSSFILGENSDTNGGMQYIFDTYPIQLIKSINEITHLPSITTLDGIIGITGPQISFRGTSLWNDLMKCLSSPIFGIDSFIPLQQKVMAKIEPYAQLLLGGTHDTYGPIIWSERRQTGDSQTDALYRFTIYDLILCNNNLLSGTSSNWEAQIDTSSQCLVLPVFLYHNLISWTPVTVHNASYENNIAEPSSLIQYPRLIVDEDFSSLPTLSFRLGQFSSSYLHIPLEKLVYYDSELEKNVLCVTPGSTNPVDTIHSTNMTIRLGLSVLNLLYPVIDYQGYRVGLVEKYPKPALKHSEKCNPPPVCIGQQVYVSASNSCRDPKCSDYFFMTLNEKTKECQIPNYVLPLMFSFIIILALSEFGLSYFYYQLTKITGSHSR